MSGEAARQDGRDQESTLVVAGQAAEDSPREVEIDVVRRYATIVALLAVAAEVLLLALGVNNWRVALALAFPIVIGIMSGTSKNRSAEQAPDRGHLPPLYTGLVGGAALVGIGLHSTAGVMLAAVALLILAWFPIPPLRLLVIALAAVSPWVAETIADAQGVGSLLLGVLVIAVAALIWVRSKDVDVLVVALSLAAILYVAASIALYFLSFQAHYTDAYLSEALTSYGPFTRRWRLPLSTSWVTVPTVAALGAALCVWVLRIDGGRIGTGARAIKAVCIGGIVLHLVAVFAANGRTQVIAALVGAVVASGVLPKVVRNGLALASSALWLAPLWWDRFAGIANSLVVDYLPIRGTAARTATLQGRTIIWDVSVDRFGRGSLVEQVSGWGPDGFIGSGAAAQYSAVLGEAYRSDYYPPHNAFLEVLLSGGFTLAVVFVAGIAFLFAMQLSVLRHGSPATAAGTAGLIITLAALAFPEVAVLPSNASVAAIAAPMVTLVTLAAYRQAVLMRGQRDPGPASVSTTG